MYWEHRLWVFLGVAGKGQSPLAFCVEQPPFLSYKTICKWLLLVLGLEVPRLNQAVNLGWLLLVLGLGPLSKRYRGWGLSEASCCFFERV